ncbi:hypothetical protein E2C01_050826 [Portunus trituberculatus]|uniref:Uncharacterized protein n=1 Tax=Portunus trituberculatus TaxID=210409 RepID=A0A5B7G9C3_PORTR|nr:hypothetical protein [Portunus trituberculatus]
MCVYIFIFLSFLILCFVYFDLFPYFISLSYVCSQNIVPHSPFCAEI